jgi:hypothetical protein
MGRATVAAAGPVPLVWAGTGPQLQSNRAMMPADKTTPNAENTAVLSNSYPMTASTGRMRIFSTLEMHPEQSPPSLAPQQTTTS